MNFGRAGASPISRTQLSYVTFNHAIHHNNRTRDLTMQENHVTWKRRALDAPAWSFPTSTEKNRYRIFGLKSNATEYLESFSPGATILNIRHRTSKRSLVFVRATRKHCRKTRLSGCV
jgi:hypothetical protein